MSRAVGIDIRPTHVRAALVRASYRRVVVERLVEVDVAAVGSVESAVQACTLQLTQHHEAVAVAIDGEQAFVHRLKLPPTAQKQLDEIVPFELEAQVPVDMEELVFDKLQLRRASATDPLLVLAAAARTEHVRRRIELVRSAIGREPERVGCGPLPLANLARVLPPLDVSGPIALIDLGGRRTEVVVLNGSEAAYARTLSRGVEGLPDTAPMLAAELRQTFGAWAAAGNAEVVRAFLLGGGAAAEGAEAYLTHEVGVEVRELPALQVETTPEQLQMLPRFAKALALALGLSGRPSDLDLRQGPLGFQRGYGFIKEKIPLLSGLAAAILISFLFSTWAELRGIERENEVLTAALGSLSTDVLGETTEDPAVATELLDRLQRMDEPDPMPRADAFDVLVQISNAIPMSITHDIEEFDMQRGHVRVNGIAGSTADAQKIAQAVGKHACIGDVKISKTTQVINSDRQKYVMEFDVKCPEEGAKKKKAKEAEPEATEGEP